MYLISEVARLSAICYWIVQSIPLYHSLFIYVRAYRLLRDKPLTEQKI